MRCSLVYGYKPKRFIPMIEYFLSQYPESTRQIYLQTLVEAERRLGKSLIEFDHEDVVKYQQSIADQASSTVSRKLATLSSYFKYLTLTGKRLDNPTLGIRRPKIDPLRSVQWLTDERIDALLSADFPDARSRAIVWLALHGLRLAEITNLDINQYSDGMLWNVVGKGNKARTIPLAEEAQKALEQYIGARKSGPMFLSVRGGRIPRRTVQEMVYHLTEITGGRVSIHALRHTFGTRAIRNGVNPLTLSRLMGHNSTQTTNKYVHLNPQDLQEATEKVYPTKATVPIAVIDGGRSKAG